MKIFKNPILNKTFSKVSFFVFSFSAGYYFGKPPTKPVVTSGDYVVNGVVMS